MAEASPVIGEPFVTTAIAPERVRRDGAGLRPPAEPYSPPSVQDVVDQLSARLDRAIAIDDHQLRLVAFSLHRYGVDTVRLDSILNREASPQVTEWVHSHSIRAADPFVRIPENSELDMRPRVCMPIRHQGIVLGYLWLIEEFRILTDTELELATAAANEAGPIMYVERTLQDERRQREGEVVHALLADSGVLAKEAANTALDGQLIWRAALYTVLVIGAGVGSSPRSTGEASRVLGALGEARRRLASGSCMTAMLGHRGVMLIGTSDLPAIEVGVNWLDQALAGDVSLSDWRISVGAPVGELSFSARSYETALSAFRVALHALEDEPRPVWWSHMPAWRLISCLADDEITRAAIHPAIAKLKADRHGDVLLETLETYLDHGGDARASAEQLYMHRTSLYSRLQRIEAITGVNLHDGEDRLALHISLRVARLMCDRSATAAPSELSSHRW